MKPRSVELSLLVIASAITCFGYWLAAQGTTADLPTNVLPFLAIVLGLLVGAHFIIRIAVPFADGLIFPLAALLNGLGFMMIARLNPELAMNQAIWTFLGLAAFVGGLIYFSDVRMLEPFRYLLAVGGVILLLLPLVPGLGATINGSSIWVKLTVPVLGAVSIQPAEVAKVVLAAFLASYLAEKKDLISIESFKIGPISLPAIKYFAPLLAAMGLMLAVMVYQRDLGTSLLFFILFLVMIYVATGRSVYVFSGLALFMCGAFTAWRMFDHVQVRVAAWRNPFADVKGDGFQVAEAQFAMADGGVTGTGLGFGTPNKIPVVESDMIFAAFAEELGLLGASAILITILLFVSSGVRIALSASSEFERLFATGLVFLLGFQAFIIIGGTLRLLPLTGVTLPFVSYGGSSLIANYVIIAILMRISHNSVVAATKELVNTTTDEKVKWKAVAS